MMKRTLSLALAGMLACAALAACAPVSGGSDSSEPSSAPSSEAASQATSSTEETSPWLVTLDSTIVDVQPLIAVDPYAPGAFGGEPAEQHIIRTLCLYTDTAGKTGVIDMDGNIFYESSVDLEYCPVCMLATKDDHRKATGDGTLSEEPIGHGGFASSYYCREDCTVYQLDMEGYVPLPEEFLGGGIYEAVAKKDQLEGFSIPATDDFVLLAEGGTLLVERAEKAFLCLLPDEKSPVYGVCVNGMYGFIDLEGQTVIPLKYEGAGAMSEGCVPVRKNGKWGYIDTNDQRITEFLYEEARPVINGKAYVKDDGLWHVIGVPGAE